MISNPSLSWDLIAVPPRLPAKMSMASLPVELVHEICSYLQLSEWKALRLTCRELCSKSLERFMGRYFKSITFIATSNGIRELEEVTQSDNIREHVQELWMIPTVFESNHEINELDDCEYDVPSDSCQSLQGDELEARRTTILTIIEDNLNLINSEAFSTRLHTCLKSFKNVDTIGIAHYMTSFLLDPRQQKVRFLGWRNLRDKIECRFDPVTLMYLHGLHMGRVNSLALSRLLQALNGCNLKIRKLHTCNADYCGEIGREIHLAQGQYGSLLSDLDELEDLHVCINLQQNRRSRFPESHMVLSSQTWLNLIIKVAPQLIKLTLSHDNDGDCRLRPYYFKELFKSIEFTQLRELHFHRTRVTSGVLKLLVTRAKATLTTLTLYGVNLYEGAFREADDDLDFSAANIFNFPVKRRRYSPRNVNDSSDSDDFEEPRALIWKSVWDFFRNELSLQKFSMIYLIINDRPIVIQGFDGLIKRRKDASFDSETAGISFGEWIDQLTPVELDEYVSCWWRENDGE